MLIGGDGTLHAVANICGHKPEVALLPRGRANNMARALGVPLGLKSAARLAVQGIAHPIDGIAVEAPGLTMTALEGVSVGFHAQARALYRGVNSADTAAGVAAAVRAFTHFEPVSLALEIDGESEVRRRRPALRRQLSALRSPTVGRARRRSRRRRARGRRARRGNAGQARPRPRAAQAGNACGPRRRPDPPARQGSAGTRWPVAGRRGHDSASPGPVELAVRPRAVHIVGPGR